MGDNQKSNVKVLTSSEYLTFPLVDNFNKIFTFYDGV